jgi:anti-sigma factor RsiW
MTSPEDMACRELVEVITDYLEGTLPELDRLRFEAHLSDCPGCRTYLEQMRQTVAVLGALPPEPIAEQDRLKVLDLFRDWKRTQGD